MLSAETRVTLIASGFCLAGATQVSWETMTSTSASFLSWPSQILFRTPSRPDPSLIKSHCRLFNYFSASNVTPEFLGKLNNIRYRKFGKAEGKDAPDAFEQQLQVICLKCSFLKITAY